MSVRNIYPAKEYHIRLLDGECIFDTFINKLPIQITIVNLKFPEFSVPVEDEYFMEVDMIIDNIYVVVILLKDRKVERMVDNLLEMCDLEVEMYYNFYAEEPDTLDMDMPD